MCFQHLRSLRDIWMCAALRKPLHIVRYGVSCIRPPHLSNAINIHVRAWPVDEQAPLQLRVLRMQAYTRTACLWAAPPRGCSQPGYLWAMWTLRTALPWYVPMLVFLWQMFASCLKLRH